MKTIILFLALLAVGCTADEVESTPKQAQECGIIMKIEDRPDVDLIYVRMPYHNEIERDCYIVSNWKDYRLNQKICDFSNLQKTAW